MLKNCGARRTAGTGRTRNGYGLGRTGDRNYLKSNNLRACFPEDLVTVAQRKRHSPEKADGCEFESHLGYKALCSVQFGGGRGVRGAHVGCAVQLGDGTDPGLLWVRRELEYRSNLKLDVTVGSNPTAPTRLCLGDRRPL